MPKLTVKEAALLGAMVDESIYVAGGETVDDLLQQNMSYCDVDILMRRTGFTSAAVRGLTSALGDKGLVVTGERNPTTGVAEAFLSDAGIRAGFEHRGKSLPWSPPESEEAAEYVRKVLAQRKAMQECLRLIAYASAGEQIRAADSLYLHGGKALEDLVPVGMLAESSEYSYKEIGDAVQQLEQQGLIKVDLAAAHERYQLTLDGLRRAITDHLQDMSGKDAAPPSDCLRVYGASDDLVQFRGAVRSVREPGDEESPDGYAWLPEGGASAAEVPLGLLDGERDVGGHFVLTASTGQRLRLAPVYDRCWSFAVGQVEPGDQLPPVTIVATETDGQMPGGGLHPSIPYPNPWLHDRACRTAMVVIELPGASWDIEWHRAPRTGLEPRAETAVPGI